MSFSESDIPYFCVDLRKVFLSIPDADKIILFGDLNDRIGKNCLGSHGIGNANSNSIHILVLQRAWSCDWKHSVSTEKTNARVHDNTHIPNIGI